MRVHFLVVTIATVALLEIPAPAWGQFNRSTGMSSSALKSGSTGMFGSRFTPTTGTSSNSNGLSSGNGLSSNNRSSGSSSNPLGGISSDQLLRSARGANNFVGADANDNRNFLGYANSSSGNSNTTSFGNSNYGPSRLTNSQLGTSRNSNPNANANRTQRTSYGQGTSRYGTSRYGRSTVTPRPTYDLGFDYDGPASNSLSTQLNARLVKTPNLHLAKPVQVSLENGTAVLRGTTSSEHERRLVEQLVLLEPGVRQVDNQLTVSTAPAKEPAAK